ncbi:hypothetical protein [Arthrobacter woluwensis]|uniref:hypothetical protein n=1 Tax=Arthrobacter woluwensis TaxID=156980 RepID=UPI001AAFD7E4|nr:hypothetical protein [Arthrobacter woluwensis]QTF70779.1 hypothetical protein G8758_01175 [Arthrobacter woluwensis]
MGGGIYDANVALVADQELPARPRPRRLGARRASLASVAALGLMCVLPACGVATDAPGHDHASSAQGASVVGNSTLDHAGVAKITADRSARFDFSSGTLTRNAVGLGQGLQSPMVDLRGTGMMDLRISAPQGEITARTDVLNALVYDGKDTVDELSFFLTTESKDEYIAAVRAAVTDYGIDQARVEEWIRGLNDHPTGRHYSALPPGYKTGLEVIYDLRFDYDKKVQVIIVTVGPKP